MLQSKEQVGKLDRKITIQKPDFETNEANEREIVGWSNIDVSPTPWANVLESFGSESMQADQVTGVKTSTFIIRYRTDVTIEYRILHQEEIYNILTMLEIGRKGFLKIVAESGGHYQETET